MRLPPKLVRRGELSVFLKQNVDVGHCREAGDGRREATVASDWAIVQRPTRNFNVTGRSVEMAAQKFYTDAKFACCGKTQRHNTNGGWGSKG
jgi:hypothetical protein